MADCPSLNGFSFHVKVFTSKPYDPDDDESLERAKRSARATVENGMQRQMADMRAQQRAWEAEQTCEPPCTGTFTEREEPNGPIHVRIIVRPRSVHAVAEMHLSSTWSCDEPEQDARTQQTAPIEA